MIITIPSQDLGQLLMARGWISLGHGFAQRSVRRLARTDLGRIVTCFFNFVGLLAYGKYIITPRDVVQNDGR